jgi:hypothetical protein
MQTKRSNPRIPPNVPEPPKLQKGIVTDTSITITWEDYQYTVDGFIIEYDTGGITPCVMPDGCRFDMTETLPGSQKNYLHTPIEDDTAYTYRICAIVDGQKSEYSDVLNVWTKRSTPGIPPGKPKPPKLQLKGLTDRSVTISWKGYRDKVDGFILEYINTAVPAPISVGYKYKEIARPGADQVIFTHYDLKPNAHYFYRIRAYVGDWKSEYSNEVEVDTKPAKEWTSDNPVSGDFIN